MEGVKKEIVVEKDVNEHVVNLKKEKEKENVKKLEEREGANQQRYGTQYE